MFIEYTISEETIEKLKALEKEAIDLVEKDQNYTKALSLLDECIQIEDKYASAYNNR